MNHRYIARIKVEATTPLFVGSGAASLITDSLVMKDHNGLPMIPGTSLTGVLRHSLEDYSNDKEKWNKIFGFQGKNNEGLGSRIIVSSAYMLLNDEQVSEGLNIDIPEYITSKFQKLPTRQHVRITHKGVAADKGLFDNEVVYAGAQFVFEIELKGKKEDKKVWDQIIETIQSSSFRIGQGTRNGYGNLKVIGLYEKEFDLEDENHFNEYLNLSPSFNSIKIEGNGENTESKYANYRLELKPDDFFIFSEGFGDAEVDNKPVTEEVIEYVNGEISFNEKTLIPASSIKGAIAHRVAYYYNRENKNPDYNGGQPVFAENLIKKDKKGKLDFSDYTDEANPAVSKLFGKKGEVKEIDGKKVNTGQRGILLMDDLYYDDIDNNKIFNHVAIDRFTGGGIDGALFSEKVSYKKDQKIVLEINLSETIKGEIEAALEETLKDICRGLLPLGGMTTKGFGMFTGQLLKSGVEVFNYNNQKVEI